MCRGPAKYPKGCIVASSYPLNGLFRIDGCCNREPEYPNVIRGAFASRSSFDSAWVSFASTGLGKLTTVIVRHGEAPG